MMQHELDLFPAKARLESFDRTTVLVATCAIGALSICAAARTAWSIIAVLVLTAICLQAWRYLQTLSTEQKAVQALAVRAHCVAAHGHVLRMIDLKSERPVLR